MAERDELLALDERHRKEALDPRQSYLVQAPAGSGKTELLIQRYLALLATVARPQRVVAMTFTRKAASEMRERVLVALRKAQENAPVATPHEAVTRELAAAALRHGREQAWSLLEHPAQLSIFTIDALSSAVARQAPLASKLGGSLRAIDDATLLYREAAHATLTDANVADVSWRTLLAHLDNDADAAVTLIASMLAKREQWLHRVVGADPAALRVAVERALREEIDTELEAVRSHFDEVTLARIARCARYAVANLRDKPGSEDLARALERCIEHGGVPTPSFAHVGAWRGLVEWLLKADDKPCLRESVNVRQGFPPGKAAGTHKQDMHALLESLAGRAGLAEALHIVRKLPDPAFQEGSWDMIAALLGILPQAAAQLRLVFAAHGTIDFPELTLAAHAALGQAEVPSELLLRLDLSLDHLLVDEFQDTSVAQFRLIELLTAGWVEGDGRTLFAVGDPMQSIYRFRNAEVRLFLEAQASGRIGSVPVRFLDLARNFRSQGHLVTWANRVFAQVLAPGNDPWRGAVAFAAAIAAVPEGIEGKPTLDIVVSPYDEAARVVERVKAAQDADATDIAILVRARMDLEHILPALRRAGIAFAAVELDSLAERQAVLDLLSLTHALVQPADRLAALAVLRAPWCGLVLSDLFAVADHLGQGLQGLFERVDDVEKMTDDGRARLARAAALLRPAIADHGGVPIADRVRGAWLALGGPATVDEAIDLAAAEDYFTVLRRHTLGGDVRDWQALLDDLARSYASSDEEPKSQVKVMTLFKAKGLEFDTVILPGLARSRRGDDPELLHWRARPHGLLLATPRARAGGRDPIHDYLVWLAAAEADHELGRVLYVGATRARRRLHLVASASTRPGRDAEWQTPDGGSALRKLWDVLAQDRGVPSEAAAQSSEEAPVAPPLRRLRAGFVLPPLPAAVTTQVSQGSAAIPVPLFEWAHATAAAIGTVVHRLLAQVGREGLAAFDDTRIARLSGRIRTELIEEGVDAGELARAEGDVTDALTALRTDARGRWLFDPAHSDAMSEWALAGVDEGALSHVTLDRSFVADGVRWIVDFKTGRHEGAGTALFLDREVARYRSQLDRYGRIVRALDPRPIRLALYYPLVRDGWREWPFEPPGTQTTLF